MKIGILTIYSLNLGNRLQNYALQEYLETFNFQVETFQRIKDNRSFIKKTKNNISSYIKRDKISCFRWFNKKIHWSNDVVSKKYISDKINEHYDYIVAGSDQLWNPNFEFNSELDFMTFVPRYKRISYAASFGVSQIESHCIEKYATLLKEIPYLSVREESGKTIVKTLTGLNAYVMPDPTILLTRNKWIQVERKPHFEINKNYCLVYFIGEYTLKIKKSIFIDAQSNNLQVIEIIKDRSQYDKMVGPAEFLWLIRHSQYVYTDSYHGSVLTLILQRKNLVVFDRKGREQDMSSRFDTLWNTFNLLEKIERSDESCYVSQRAMCEIDEKQKELIKKAKRFFDIAFGKGAII